MRDKVAAVLDITWIAAAIVWSFTVESAALVIAGALLLVRGALFALDRGSPENLLDRPSWRYWTEPKIQQAERWPVTYWASLTAGLGLLAVARFLLGLQWNDMRSFGLTPTLATLTGWGWWNASKADTRAGGATRRDRA